MYVCVYIYIYIYKYISSYIRIHVCIYIYIYTYVYTYTHYIHRTHNHDTLYTIMYYYCVIVLYIMVDIAYHISRLSLHHKSDASGTPRVSSTRRHFLTQRGVSRANIYIYIYVYIYIYNIHIIYIYTYNIHNTILSEGFIHIQYIYIYIYIYIIWYRRGLCCALEISECWLR